MARCVTWCAAAMLLMLERAGQITLPPVSYVRHNPLAQRARPEPVLIDKTPIEDSVAQTATSRVSSRCGAPRKEPLFNSLMEEHHYLGYEQPVGEHLKYLVWVEGRPSRVWLGHLLHAILAARSLYRMGCRGAAEPHPFYRVQHALLDPSVGAGEHLASHILAGWRRGISDDWQQMYGHPIYFLETFIDRSGFRGTCYRAANWVLMGRTTGRGKQSNSYVPNRSIKEVLGYPLTKRFRELLGAWHEEGPAPHRREPGRVGPGFWTKREKRG